MPKVLGPRPEGRSLTDDVRQRMYVLLMRQGLPAPLVARRLGCSERSVQVYRRLWLAAGATPAVDPDAQPPKAS